MRSYAKVVTLLVVLGAALALGEEATTAAAERPEGPKEQEEANEDASKEGDSGKKSTEKRGLFRVTGVHGENPQAYQPFAYTEPQPIPGFQLPVESRGLGVGMGMGVGMPKPYPYGAPSFQQAYAVPPPPAPQPAAFPYSAPMLLLMMPPHAGNPYPTFFMVPAGNLLPHYSPNHVLPYQQPRVQFVPQYVPVKSYPSAAYQAEAPIKSYQSVNYPAAHFKGDYAQKPSQYYQEQPSASSEEESATPPASYATPPASYATAPPSYASASAHRTDYKG